MSKIGAQDHTIYTNIQALDDLKRKAREDQQSALRPVAEQFESMFLEMILKESRKVKLDDGWLDGEHMDTYLDLHDKQMAQELATKGSFGFADQIVEQLTREIPSLSPEQTQKWIERREALRQEERS